MSTLFVVLALAGCAFVSPNSLASTVVCWEIEQVRLYGKRLAPVVIGDVDVLTVPPEISRINYIFFTDDVLFDQYVDDLAHALNTNLAWLREHTRLGELARRWIERGKPNDGLLRGREADDAAAWASRHPREAPPITEAQRPILRKRTTDKRRDGNSSVARWCAVSRFADNPNSAARRNWRARWESNPRLPNYFGCSIAVELRDCPRVRANFERRSRMRFYCRSRQSQMGKWRDRTEALRAGNRTRTAQVFTQDGTPSFVLVEDNRSSSAHRNWGGQTDSHLKKFMRLLSVHCSSFPQLKLVESVGNAPT